MLCKIKIKPASEVSLAEHAAAIQRIIQALTEQGLGSVVSWDNSSVPGVLECTLMLEATCTIRDFQRRLNLAIGRGLGASLATVSLTEVRRLEPEVDGLSATDALESDGNDSDSSVDAPRERMRYTAITFTRALAQAPNQEGRPALPLPPPLTTSLAASGPAFLALLDGLALSDNEASVRDRVSSLAMSGEPPAVARAGAGRSSRPARGGRGRRGKLRGGRSASRARPAGPALGSLPGKTGASLSSSSTTLSLLTGAPLPDTAEEVSGEPSAGRGRGARRRGRGGKRVPSGRGKPLSLLPEDSLARLSEGGHSGGRIRRTGHPRRNTMTGTRAELELASAATAERQAALASSSDEDRGKKKYAKRRRKPFVDSRGPSAEEEARALESAVPKFLLGAAGVGGGGGGAGAGERLPRVASFGRASARFMPSSPELTEAELLELRTLAREELLQEEAPAAGLSRRLSVLVSQYTLHAGGAKGQYFLLKHIQGHNLYRVNIQSGDLSPALPEGLRERIAAKRAEESVVAALDDVSLDLDLDHPALAAPVQASIPLEVSQDELDALRDYSEELLEAGPEQLAHRLSQAEYNTLKARLYPGAPDVVATKARRR